MANAIGEYLRARRERVRPEDVGLAAAGHRRVPGLRREEVALLAGISADYYIRLEQGRERHPSEQVLDALARALQLDGDATDHLHRLAAPRPQRKRPRRAPERVPDGVAMMIAGWDSIPAFVTGRYLDVLAANALATALVPYCRVGENVVRAAFFDPSVQAFYGDWERTTEAAVASLRALVAPDLEDPRLTELVGELSVRSQRFRELWGRHDVRPKVPGQIGELNHPQLGPLRLRSETLAIGEGSGQSLVIYHAEPGSESADKLALLASMLVTPSS